jgi:hypothetical protein
LTVYRKSVRAGEKSLVFATCWKFLVKNEEKNFFIQIN